MSTLVHEVSDSPVGRPRARTNRAGKDPVGGGIGDLCTVDENRKGLAAWLHKQRRSGRTPVAAREEVP
jgi:hypothetical protein